MTSKIKTIFTFLTILFATLHPLSLKAEEWGITSEILEHENNTWNKVDLNIKDLNLKVMIPHFEEGFRQNEYIHLLGFSQDILDNYIYLVTVPVNQLVTIKNKKDLKLCAEYMFPGSIIKSVDTKKLGAKFAVDAMNVLSGKLTYYRVLYSKNRLIIMSSQDTNNNRREFFFDSIFIE